MSTTIILVRITYVIVYILVPFLKHEAFGIKQFVIHETHNVIVL